MSTVPEEVRKNIRSVLLSKPRGGVRLLEFQRDFKKLLGYPLQYGQLGYPSLTSILKALPEDVRIDNSNPKDVRIFGILPAGKYQNSFMKKAQGLSVKPKDFNRRSFEAFVGGLPKGTKEKDLQRLFYDFKLDNIRMKLANNSQKMLAFISFGSESELHAFVEKNQNHEIFGHKLDIEVSHPRIKQSSCNNAPLTDSDTRNEFDETDGYANQNFDNDVDSYKRRHQPHYLHRDEPLVKIPRKTVFLNSERNSYHEMPALEINHYDEMPSLEWNSYPDMPALERNHNDEKSSLEWNSYPDMPALERDLYNEKSALERDPYREMPVSETDPYNEMSVLETDPNNEKPALEKNHNYEMPSLEWNSYPDMPALESDFTHEKDVTLHVANFPHNTTEVELKNLFWKYQPKVINLFRHKPSNMSKALITFPNERLLLRALKDLDGSQFGGRKLLLTLANKSIYGIDNIELDNIVINVKKIPTCERSVVHASDTVIKKSTKGYGVGVNNLNIKPDSSQNYKQSDAIKYINLSRHVQDVGIARPIMQAKNNFNQESTISQLSEEYRSTNSMHKSMRSPALRSVEAFQRPSNLHQKISHMGQPFSRSTSGIRGSSTPIYMQAPRGPHYMQGPMGPYPMHSPTGFRHMHGPLGPQYQHNHSIPYHIHESLGPHRMPVPSGSLSRSQYMSSTELPKKRPLPYTQLSPYHQMRTLAIRSIKSCFPGYELPTSATITTDDFHLYITFVHQDGYFWGHILNDDSDSTLELAQLMEKIVHEKVDYIKQNRRCAVHYQGDYYRAYVIGPVHDGSNTINKKRVFLVDYGNVLIVDIESLSTLPESFWLLPPKATPCFVAENLIGDLNELVDKVVVASVTNEGRMKRNVVIDMCLKSLSSEI